MTPLANEILAVLPRLRRYACALTGERRLGDRYIEIALETLLEEPSRIRAVDDVRRKLYELFHDVLAIFVSEDCDIGDESDEAARLRSGVLSLPLGRRKLLLLVTVEGFGIEQAAQILELPLPEARGQLALALDALGGRRSSRGRLRRNASDARRGSISAARHNQHTTAG